jgi:hypothetical protein
MKCQFLSILNLQRRDPTKEVAPSEESAIFPNVGTSTFSTPEEEEEQKKERNAIWVRFSSNPSKGKFHD